MLEETRFAALEALLNKSEMYTSFLAEQINAGSAALAAPAPAAAPAAKKRGGRPTKKARTAGQEADDAAATTSTANATKVCACGRLAESHRVDPGAGALRRGAVGRQRAQGVVSRALALVARPAVEHGVAAARGLARSRA